MFQELNQLLRRTKKGLPLLLSQIQEGESIQTFSLVLNPYFPYSCIMQEGSTDLGGAIEDTLHRVLDSGASPEDVTYTIGLVNDLTDPYKGDSGEEYVPIDLGYGFYCGIEDAVETKCLFAKLRLAREALNNISKGLKGSGPFEKGSFAVKFEDGIWVTINLDFGIFNNPEARGVLMKNASEELIGEPSRETIEGRWVFDYNHRFYILDVEALDE